MHKRFFKIALFLMLTLSLEAFAYQSPFDVSWDEGEIKLGAGQRYMLEVMVRVPSGHFLYKDKTDLSFTTLEGIKVVSVVYPPAVAKEDPFSKKLVEIYTAGDIAIQANILVPKGIAPGERTVTAELEMQGCEEKLCLRPERRVISWDMNITPLADVVTQGPKEIIIKGEWSIRSLLDSKDFRKVVEKGKLMALLIALLAGLLTSLTPCVWPLVPVTLLIIGIHKKGHVFGNLMLSVSLVLGIAVTYGLLGAFAAAAGARMSFLFEHKIFLGVIAIFFVAMSLSMFGAFTIRLPHRLQNALTKIGGRGYMGAFLCGISLGLLATPCAGPMLAPMLVWVAAQKEYAFGGTMLGAYAFGLGTVYIVAGTFYGTFASKLKNIKAGNAIKKILGVLLLLPAIYYLSAMLPSNMGNGGISWRVNEQDAVIETLSTGKPMMIVFGAKWCPPCLELKQEVLADNAVVQASAKVVPLYIDATVSSSEIDALLDKYHVVGWPTILFVGKNGKVYDDLSVVGGVPTVENIVKLIDSAVNR